MQNLVTITINSRDLAYTIDTYGMFNGDSVDEQELDYYRDEYNLTDTEAEQIQFDYNHPGVVKSLAENSVQLLHVTFVQHGNGIVTDINLSKSRSPQFYNYTTDSYDADWIIDADKLIEYIQEHRVEWHKFASDEWSSLPIFDIDAADCLKDAEDLLVAMIDYYTQNEYDAEDYESSMFEFESEAWLENMKLTPETQAMIDAKQAEIDAEAERIKNQTNLDLGA